MCKYTAKIKRSTPPRSFEGKLNNYLICNKLQPQAGLREVSATNMTEANTIPEDIAKWYALRDLKRPNALLRAWEMLEGKNMKVFTPKKWVMSTMKRQRVPKEVAFIPDLLFVYDTRAALDPIIESTDTLQYRFRKYGAQNEPIVVPDADMERFIYAVNNSESHQFYLPSEITPQMCGHKIRIVGGPFNGYEGNLLTIRGSRVKRLLVELKDFLAVGVEINPEYIQLV